MRIIFATHNKGKSKEVKSLFAGSPFEIISLYDLGHNINVEETGASFSENAFIKARDIYDLYGEPVFADDSGLAVEQLDGRPGVYSARYAGENCTYKDNNLKLIGELAQFPEPHPAKFISCALYFDGKNRIETFGELPGRIIREERGNNGFGYDPVFIPDGFSLTISEMDFEEKNKMSHRAKSFEALKKKLRELYKGVF